MLRDCEEKGRKKSEYYMNKTCTQELKRKRKSMANTSRRSPFKPINDSSPSLNAHALQRDKKKREESHKLEPIYRAIAEKVKMLHVMGNKLFEKDKRLKKLEAELNARAKCTQDVALTSPQVLMETPKRNHDLTES